MVVSVVVPVHDGEAFIADCWATLCAQSELPHEVVFVDDGSTDRTVERIRALGDSSVRVTVLSQPRLGPAAARNAGILAAQSPLIAFLDVDDAWPENKLERALQCFAEQPELEVVGGLVQLRWALEREPHNPALAAPHRRVNLGACVFRARVFQRVGLLDPKLQYGEDVDYWCRLREARVSCLELDEVTLYYQQHDSNMTRGRSARDLGLFQALAKSLRRSRPSL